MGWELREQFPPFVFFPLKNMLNSIEYHIRISFVTGVVDALGHSEMGVMKAISIIYKLFHF